MKSRHGHDRLDYYRYHRPMMGDQTAAADDDEIALWASAEALQDAVIHDCRSLNSDFVLDSGTTALDEIASLRLPHPVSYFEMAHPFSIIAWYGDDDGGYYPEIEPFHTEQFINFDVLVTGRQFASKKEIQDAIRENPDMALVAEIDGTSISSGGYLGQFENQVGRLISRMITDPKTKSHADRLGHEKLGDEYHPLEREAKEIIAHGARVLVGILTLMTEKLLLDEVVPDAEPKLTAARLKRGKLPLDGEHHVLTLNVPAVRYAASRSMRSRPLGSHESPCLHWRRGHDRVLWRGSEFERTTRVKRCLVGDPDKGFVKTSYRLVSRLPMPSGSARQPDQRGDTAD